MEIWCVDSHHKLSERPWEQKGVLLSDEDLNGEKAVSVWVSGNSVILEHLEEEGSARYELEYRKAPNSTEYLCALRGLQKIQKVGGRTFRAVVSLEWNPHYPARTLLVTHRVWLTLFDTARGPAVSFTHHPGENGGLGSPYRNFLATLEIPTLDSAVWEKFFRTKLKEAISGKNLRKAA